MKEKGKVRSSTALLDHKKDNEKTISHIYECKNGTPEQNMAKVIEMLGGIKKITGENDIVIIKPNAQWKRHGITNTNTIKGFIDLILDIPDFRGEIIIAENHHYNPDNGRGWTTEKRNGDYNLNELTEYYNNIGSPNVTKYHWHDAGSNPTPLQGNAGDGRIVKGPKGGDGYVWSDEEYNYQGRKTKMTYPIFTSAQSGKVIDFKNGIWQDGRYTEQPLKLINFSSLNHHSKTFGVTASIKNYLGIVDMTCGFQGSEPPGYYNFHYIALGWPKDTLIGNLFEEFATWQYMRRSNFLSKAIRKICPNSGALGGAVGRFMKTIRRADLNIISAEYVGHEGRWSTPVHAKTVLASTDPVALDYYAAKYLLLPLGGSKKAYNDPDNSEGAFRQYLELCHAEGIGTLNENEMLVHKFDFNKR